ncbi:DUF1329 domain-containing protein [Pseudoduganella aquatica]|uniref:DUF1329 domain-containing protein n=1 Tax=Pseudoduganella aquatica TaxID=2660641 RepID=UPI001E54EC40|nr:DUF1329 domain-containing protein [Pseudoduganella aquatica]
MKMMHTTLLAALLSAFSAQAAITPAEADKLGKELTPVGAEKAGNKEGTIPSWEGGLTKAPAGWNPAQGYADPYAGDKPLFTITAANAEQYKDKLAAGTLALLKKYPSYKMVVYPSHRSAAYPKEVTDKAKEQATKVKLEGSAMTELGGSHVPFPIPKTGQEAMSNHMTRYLGGGFDRTYDWFPVRANGDFYRVGFRELRVSDANFDTRTPNHQFSFLGFFTAPATLQGTVYLVHESIDQVKEPRQAWIYNAGQRRVRRAPDLAYDNISDGTEAMRVTDQYDAYNGALDRYEWKLVGKKEMYIPYNSYKLSDKKLKYADIIQKNSINPDLMRYELHRVWQVEATLKAGQKHIYGKRTFYLDEDSWGVVHEDAYDGQGQLWRIGVHGTMQYYDAMAPWYRVNIWHDLSNGNYLVSTLDNEIKTPWKFGVKGNWSDFQPDALRRAGTK